MNTQAYSLSSALEHIVTTESSDRKFVQKSTEYYRPLSRNLLIALFGIWALPVVNFMVFPSYAPATWPIWSAIGATLLLSVTDRRFVALAIPFAAMLSPLAHSSRILGLLPSELFVVFCGIWAMLFIFANQRPPVIFPIEKYLAGCMVMVLFAYVFSFEHATLFRPLLNCFALAVVFVVTRLSLTSVRTLPSFF